MNHSDTNVTFNFDSSQILRMEIDQGAYGGVFAAANMRRINALKNEG
jgi:ABC-type molybdate transport system substrate-binding protein